MTVMRAIGQECRDGDTAGCGAVGRSCHPCCGFDSARAADHGAGSRRRAEQEYRRILESASAPSKTTVPRS